MTKTSFFDDRQELTEIYLKPAEHLPWSFFAKIVNSFKPLTNFAKNPWDIFDWVLNTPLVYLTNQRFADLSL